MAVDQFKLYSPQLQPLESDKSFNCNCKDEIKLMFISSFFFFFFCKEYLASYEDLCTNPSFNYKCYAVFENICYISPDNKKKNSSLLFLYD